MWETLVGFLCVVTVLLGVGGIATTAVLLSHPPLDVRSVPEISAVKAADGAATHTLMFFEPMPYVPYNTITSVARKGNGWFDRTKAGDTLRLLDETGANFGSAVVVRRELVGWHTLLERHHENHDGRGRAALEWALRQQNGPGVEDDAWTMVFLVRTA